MSGKPKLNPDEKTLATIRGLGRIQCTTREAAAVLGVSHPTFLSFKERWQEVQDAFEDGAHEGKASLRRTQFKMAETNAAMAIFLGKNLLGQTDKTEQSLTGPAGEPLRITHIEIVAVKPLLIEHDAEN